MEKERIISIITDIIQEGYTLDGIVSLANDTCVTFKRKQRWIYPDTIYVTSFIENSFLFSSNEFNYRINLSGKKLSDSISIKEDAQLVSIKEEDCLTEEELDEIDAELERALENDEIYIWDEVVLDIATAIIQQNLTPLTQKEQVVIPQQKTLLKKIADFSSTFRQLLFFSGF